MRVLIAGASGFLGKKLYALLGQEHQAVGTCASHRREPFIPWDLSVLDGIPAFLDEQHPDVVIHAAAITDENLAQRNPPLAKRINADATEAMVRWCERNGARLIYISSDYVFDGEHGPYTETSTPYPLQIYGFTKLLGEIATLSHPGSAVVRVAILHGLNDAEDKFTYTADVIRTLGSGQRMVVDHGRIKYPTLIDDVARGLQEVIAGGEGGVFHVAGTEGVTRYQWGLQIARVFGLDAGLLEPDVAKDAARAPDRPRDVPLLNTRLSFMPRSLEESLHVIRDQRTTLMGNVP